MQKTIDYFKYIGIEYAIIPYANFNSVNQWEEFATELNKLGHILAENGISLLYHNHDHELKKLENDKCPLEILLNNTSRENFNLQVDCFWIKYAQIEPLEFLQKFANRIMLLHIKDIDSNKKTTEVGTGLINYKPILKFAERNLINLLVIEQDEIYIDEYESVSTSLKAVKEIITISNMQNNTKN